jgi:hypothetical protein
MTYTEKTLKKSLPLPSYSGKREGTTSIDLPSIYSSVRAPDSIDGVSQSPLIRSAAAAGRDEEA